MSKKHTPTLADLQHVDDSNRVAQSTAAQQGDSPFYSSSQVAKNTVFDSQAFDMATQANSVVKATHLDLVGAMGNGQGERVAATRGFYAEFGSQLHNVRLPNTRVNVANREIEIPSEIKQYADGIPQASYQKVMEILLGPDRMEKLYDYTVKANQSTRPALWLNQHLAIELRQQYVFRMHVEFPEHLSLMEGMTPELVQLATAQIRDATGPDLFAEIENAAKSNSTNAYAILTALVDRIIQCYEALSVPVTTMSIWDKVLARKKARQIAEKKALAHETDEMAEELGA